MEPLIQWEPIGQHPLDQQIVKGEVVGVAYDHRIDGTTMDGWEDRRILTGIAYRPALVKKINGPVVVEKGLGVTYRIVHRVCTPPSPYKPIEQRELLAWIRRLSPGGDKIEGNKWLYVPFDHYASEDEFKDFAEAHLRNEYPALVHC